LVDINPESINDGMDQSKSSFIIGLKERRELHEIERKKAISRLEPDKNPVNYSIVQSVQEKGGRSKKIVQK
jgi:hypothetical protein